MTIGKKMAMRRMVVTTAAVMKMIMAIGDSDRGDVDDAPKDDDGNAEEGMVYGAVEVPMLAARP